MAEVSSTFSLNPHDQAPPFQLPDGKGTPHSLADLAGKKGTLIIFACNHCPFVVHLAEALGSFAREVAAHDIKTIAINSNDIANFPADGPDKMLLFAADSGWDFPYLLDESQDVAHAYSAACTPDFYLFDGDQKLVYAGQFDASRPRNDKPVTGADLRRAVEALLANEPPLSPQLPSSGCNIKWKAGNEPAYFA